MKSPQWEILRAPPNPITGAHDDYDCSVTVDNKPMAYDLALMLDDAKRARIQFNNDNSGRMIIFEGTKTSTVVVTVDAITVDMVEGQPKKTKMTKATGLCIPYNDSYENREVHCQARTVDGRLFTASIERQTALTQ